VIASLGGCASGTSTKVSRANQHRAFRLSSGDSLGMQILRNDPDYSAAGNDSASMVSAEQGEQNVKQIDR
jgi:hypothetical protein